MKKKEKTKNPIQPVSGTKVPRFAGPSTFARLPEIRDVKSCDVAIVGIPFDAGTSYRPGARFGPAKLKHKTNGFGWFSRKLVGANLDASELDENKINEDAS